MFSAWIRRSATSSAATRARTTGSRLWATGSRPATPGRRRGELHPHPRLRIDSHRHTWETVIRGIAPDVSLGGYFDLVLDQLAPAYRPEDVYAGSYLGSLEAIDAGVTTLLDWSPSRTPPSTPTRAIRALDDSGSGPSTATNPNTSLAAWWFEAS
jgi:hypothetical protein